MKPETLEHAIRLGTRLGNVLVATADRNGLPHIAVSRRIESVGYNHLALSEWFCPRTLSNLMANPRVSIVVWDPEEDAGFQLLGLSEGIQETSILNGLDTGPHEEPLPQVERRILVRIDRIVRFSHGPHSDVEEG